MSARLFFALIIASCVPTRGAGTGGGGEVHFGADIAPLLQRRCLGCHNEDSAKGGYRLDTFTQLQKPGETENPVLVAGKPAESELYRLLLETDPHDRMPQKADPLPAAEIALIKRWIENGAPYDGGSPARPLVELARAVHLRAAPERYAKAMPISALAVSPDGTQVAVGGYYEITIWNVADGALARRVAGLPERITGIAWVGKATQRLAFAGGTPGQWGTVGLIEPARDWAVRLFCDLPESGLSVALSPDGNLLLAGAGDKTARLWETDSGKQVALWKHHADWVQAVAFSPDGKHMLTASRDRTVRVIDASSLELTTTYTGHESPVMAAGFMSDSKTILSLGTDRIIHTWDRREGDREAKKSGFAPNALGLLVAGRIAVTPTADGRIVLRQISDRKDLLAFFGHREPPLTLAAGPQTVLASGGADGRVYLWSPHCETWLQSFLAFPR